MNAALRKACLSALGGDTPRTRPCGPGARNVSVWITLAALAACGAPDLTVRSYTSDGTFAVGSYLVSGEREAVLIDGQFTKADAEKAAQLVKDSGKTLKLIFLSHAHPDHYLGLEVLQRAFPGVPIQALPEVVSDFNAKGPGTLAALQGAFPPGTLPDRLATVTALGGDRIVIEGQELEVVKLPAGEAEVSAVLYGRRQGLLFAGDNLYHRAFLWLAECRADGWSENIGRLRALGPLLQVYPGHGPAPATAEVLDEDLAYLREVVPLLGAAADPAAAIAQVKARYPGYTGSGLLEFSTPTYFTSCRR